MTHESWSPLPDAVVRFLTAHITSLSELEVLRLLSRRTAAMSAADVSRELRLGEYFAELILDRLSLSNLVAANDSGYEVVATGEELEALRTLVDLLDKYRVRIATLILAAEPVEDVQMDAD
ncbi:MAG TPA: hypothetical protein VF230_13655 [Acidimicrobiales bacterium]